MFGIQRAASQPIYSSSREVAADPEPSAPTGMGTPTGGHVVGFFKKIILLNQACRAIEK